MYFPLTVFPSGEACLFLVDFLELSMKTEFLTVYTISFSLSCRFLFLFSVQHCFLF